MVPYAVLPGKDVGITKEDYTWLLKQCRAKTDWQLTFRVSADAQGYSIACAGAGLRARGGFALTCSA